MREPSREMMYEGWDGTRQDSSLHGPILGDVPHHVPPVTRDIAANCGLTHDEMVAFFGEPR